MAKRATTEQQRIATCLRNVVLTLIEDRVASCMEAVARAVAAGESRGIYPDTMKEVVHQNKLAANLSWFAKTLPSAKRIATMIAVEMQGLEG